MYLCVLVAVGSGEERASEKLARGDLGDRLDFRFGNPSGERQMIKLAQTVIDEGTVLWLHGMSGELPIPGPVPPWPSYIVMNTTIPCHCI